MGVTLYYGYYPKECNNQKVLPFLTINDEYNINGSHMSPDFYEALRQYSEWNEDCMCWIFDDNVKLFEFAKIAPSDMCDYLVDPVFYYFINVEHEPDDVFIVWKR